MDFKEKLSQDLHEALKARQPVKVSTLRLLLAAVKNKEIQTAKPLTDQQVMELVSKEVKQRRESIAEFEKGGRADLAAKEQAEWEILKVYLPEPLSESELQALIAQAAEESQAKGPSDMGKLMKAVLAKTAGRADGKTLQEKVKSFLAGA